MHNLHLTGNHYNIIICTLVEKVTDHMCAAPPIVGAWSMAVLLWQLLSIIILLITIPILCTQYTTILCDTDLMKDGE